MTELIYLSEMSRLDAEATVQQTGDHDGRTTIRLDRTVFYPQGGGQPFDTGSISGDAGRMRVEEVRWIDGEVAHIGPVEGMLSPGERVRLAVDPDRRRLHTRLHSAGHVVDMAIDRLGLGWVPGKGYHFPQGPYVEYDGELEGDKDQIARTVETEVRNILAEGHLTRTRFVDAGELAGLCRFVPPNLPEDEPTRVVSYGDFGVACGGTHVASLDEIGSIGIRKLKAKGRAVRVSYEVG